MKHLPWLLCVLLVVSTVSAQESSVPSAAQNAAPAPETLTPLVIEVRAQRVSRSALSDALLKELRQGGKPGEVEQPKGALELSDSASNTVRLTYRDALGRVTTRDLYIAPDDPEALEKITIAAANLVRDQTGAISALEAQARAEEEAALKALENAPKPEPKPAPAPPAPTKPVYDPCHPPLAIPFGVDLAPMLGTSSTPLGRQTARRVSLGLAGTYSAGVHGIQLSIATNIDRRGMCGAEFAVGLNLNLGDGRGLQLAVLNATLGALRGAQLGVANFARKGVYGVQLGVANVSLGPVKAELGVLNVANGDTKIQLGVANFTGANAQGQLGVANVAWGNASGQLGVVNIAKERVKSQFGVFNYAGSARAPLGVISIVRDGHTAIEAWVNENGALYGMLSHGGDRIYNMYGVGARFQKEYAKNNTRLALVYGIGVRMYNDPRFALDLQMMQELYPRVSPWRNHSQTERLRLAAEIKLSERMSLVPAVGYAIMISEWASEPVQALFGESTFRHQRIDSNGKRHVGVYGFPSFALGFRVLLSNPKKPRD
jgi:hypothetical protein